MITASFLIEGQQFTALNGGPLFSFTVAISFVIHCQTQEEVDHYWNKLSEGGEEVQCGWLKDKFGVSWQVLPEALGRLLNNPNPNEAQRAMQAMFTMKKIDISQLQEAADRV